jgi:hypothetical protein
MLDVSKSVTVYLVVARDERKHFIEGLQATAGKLVEIDDVLF